jgi:hypothetical protein
MFDVAAFLSSYLAFALLHGASATRFPSRRWRPTRAWIFVMRGLFVPTSALTVRLFSASHGTGEGVLLALLALCASATAFVLLAPVRPRISWGLALSCPALITMLAILGAAGG